MPGPEKEEQRRAELQYRHYADELFRIAEQTTDAEERERLLQMAEAWLQLAARMKEVGDT